MDPFKSLYLSSEQTSYTTSVTRLGDFESFGKNISSKRSPNDWQLFGLFRKTCIFYFLGNFWKNWATFYSNIWSHCTRLPHPPARPVHPIPVHRLTIELKWGTLGRSANVNSSLIIILPRDALTKKPMRLNLLEYRQFVISPVSKWRMPFVLSLTGQCCKICFACKLQIRKGLLNFGSEQ